MPVVPKTASDKIAFYQSHNAPWSTNAIAIGTTAAAVTALQTKTTAASNALAAQLAAQDAAKTATQTLKNAVDAMQLAGSSIIAQIRAQASITGDGVYTLAQIPAPATPSPMGAPGTPYKFDATLDGNGAVNLKWKCSNPSGASGTMYQVYRSIGSTGEPTYLGGSGTKTFVDNTIPAGTNRVTYQIQAVRSTGSGQWATFNVNFGNGGSTMSIEAAPVKRAA